MTEEDRLLAQFDKACRQAANRLGPIPNYDLDDLYQEARIAAVEAIRSYRHVPGRSVFGYAHECIKRRMGRLLTVSNTLSRKIHWASVVSYDAMEWEGNDDSHDIIKELADRDNTQDVMERGLLDQCLRFCESEAERAIISSIWDDDTLADAGRWVGLTRSRMHQIKNELMARLRREVMTSG